MKCEHLDFSKNLLSVTTCYIIFDSHGSDMRVLKGKYKRDKKKKLSIIVMYMYVHMYVYDS